MINSRLDEIREIRLAKVARLRELGIEPYPAQSAKDHVNSDILGNFGEYEGKTVTLAGRLMSFREHGNIAFGHIQDETGRIQLFIQKKILSDTSSDTQTLGFKDATKLLDVGDFVEVTGTIGKTVKGEISLLPTHVRILSKSIRPLPEKWHGLQDVEERYRKRYLDLVLNKDVRARFNTRTLIFRETRKYLDDLGFWEVETPTLQPLYGGANAKPFTTHHNSLGSDFYLRIADELYLKRLIAGGYGKVYEICKDFRNEGIDQTHSPEFTMIEYYESYADYQRVMDVTEGLFKHLAKNVLNSDSIQVGDKKIDISKPWDRIKMTDLIRERLDLDVFTKDQKELEDIVRENKLELIGGESWGQLVFKLFDDLISHTLIDPVWVIDYPKDVSPLSKNHPETQGFVQRFEGYIGGKEICDGWSELTDPIEQRERFESDVAMSRGDKSEAQQVDEDFLEAMEYGMPPIGGIGIGMDRLTMFFTNTWMIKEVILFPTLKPTVKKFKKTKK